MQFEQKKAGEGPPSDNQVTLWFTLSKDPLDPFFPNTDYKSSVGWDSF